MPRARTPPRCGAPPGAAHGVELDGLEVEVAGRTDAAIARDLLRAAGVADATIDERAEAVARDVVAAYEELCPPDLSRVRRARRPRGARRARGASASATGSRSSPATSSRSRGASSPPPGSATTSSRGQGGFGSDSEHRDELPGVARARAGGWARERTVVIGDTPRDIACARADGVRVVAVATGLFSAEELAEADAVVDGARSVLPVLEDFATA